MTYKIEEEVDFETEGWNLEEEIAFLRHQLGLLDRDLSFGNTDIALERIENLRKNFSGLVDMISELDEANPHTPVE